MASYTAADIKALRERTGAGMLDVKKALDEAEGDSAKAIEILRVKGLKGITKREGRSASNGLVAAQVDGGTGVLVEVNCETDFVAKGERFKELAAQVLAAAVASGATDAESLAQAPVEGGTTVQALLDEGNATLGEKIEVRRVARLTGGHVASYLHRTSPDLPPQIGVLLAVDGGDEATARDVALHIAAMSPTVLTTDGRARGDARERAPHRPRDRGQRGQARAGAAQDRRGPGQGLPQGERPARAGVQQGQQEDRRAGALRGGPHRHGVRPLPGRVLRH